MDRKLCTRSSGEHELGAIHSIHRLVREMGPMAHRPRDVDRSANACEASGQAVCRMHASQQHTAGVG
eukprot:3723059-Pleurochrysis_carterae.AAC.2